MMHQPVERRNVLAARAGLRSSCQCGAARRVGNAHHAADHEQPARGCAHISRGTQMPNDGDKRLWRRLRAEAALGWRHTQPAQRQHWRRPRTGVVRCCRRVRGGMRLQQHIFGARTQTHHMASKSSTQDPRCVAVVGKRLQYIHILTLRPYNLFESNAHTSIKNGTRNSCVKARCSSLRSDRQSAKENKRIILRIQSACPNSSSLEITFSPRCRQFVHD